MNSMRTALVIPIYNRPEYVAKCFKSLMNATPPSVIILVDDFSRNKDTVKHISDFKENYTSCPVVVIRNSANEGVKQSLLKGIEHAFNPNSKRGVDGADLIINLDSDAIVKPDFVKRVTELHTDECITSGFNNPKEVVIKTGTGWVMKRHANGINMCFDRAQYEQHIKPALLAKVGNWDYMASESAGRVAITIPSCVQHIGMVSSMGHKGADVAQDFKMLELPNVTLFGIDSHNQEGIKRAATISQRDIQFSKSVIITDDLFTKGGTTEQRRRDYSEFMIKELNSYFDTSHVLTIHADGYVLNWEAWDNDWLQYDYIGATWGYKDGMNVGNGGFSLRSKKLCEILASHELEYMHPEDHHICRTYRPELERMGIRFAPAEVADKFSIEAYGNVYESGNRYSGQFGFHGVHVDMSELPHDIRYPIVKKSSITVKKKVLPLRR